MTGVMRCLSVFSGIGAHDLGLQMAGITIAGQIEIDPYCTAVLEKHWPDVPRWTDVRVVTGDDVRRRCGRIDLITGGFPCQDISAAGKGTGLHGDRSALFFELARLLDEVRPTWLLFENVPALRSRGADRVLAELDGLGYARWPCVVGAWAVGAPHKRDRVWIVGHRMAEARSGEPWRGAEQLEGGEPAHGQPTLVLPESSRGSGAERAGVHRANARWYLADAQNSDGWAGECGAEAGVGTVSIRGRGSDLGGAGAAGVSDARREGLSQSESEAVLGQGRGKEGRAVAELPSPLEHTSGPGLRTGVQSEAWWADARCPLRWPARPGEAQYDWEAPRLVYTRRLVEPQVSAGDDAEREQRQAQRRRPVVATGTGAASGDPCPESGPTEPGLGGTTPGLARRLDSYRRRNRLKALGNANPPWVPHLIGRWLMKQEDSDDPE